MKALKFTFLAAIAISSHALAGDIETAYVRFDELRTSNASASEKAYGVFEYTSTLSRLSAKPASFEGCLLTLKGFGGFDPCTPVFGRVIEGGGTGGVD